MDFFSNRNKFKKTKDIIKLKNDTGFTIIEFLVVIAIVAVLSGIMVVNFRSGEEANRLQRSAQQVIQGMREAQNMALSAVEYQGQVYNYYGVHFNRQSMPGFFYIYVNSGVAYNSGSEIKTITLEDGIIISAVSTGAQLDAAFMPPHAFVEFNPPVDDATITIKKQDGTCPQDCRYIKINEKGWMTISQTP